VVEQECVWFECEDEELDEFTLRFAVTVRRRAASWPLSPCSTAMYPPGDRWPMPAHAYLDVSVPGLQVTLLTVGVHLDGDRIRADEVHNQDFSLPKVATVLAMEATGTAEELGEAACDWFEGILRRRVRLLRWVHDGHVYAERYQFTDGYPLAQHYSREFAPVGQSEELIAAGFVHGKGWIQTVGLGTPDHIEELPGYPF
jgi:hypothetical protein